jgi:hypothetical protein
MRMEHDGDRRVLDARRMVSSLDPAGGTGKDDFGHSDLDNCNLKGFAAVLSTYGALDGSGRRA